MFLYLSLLLPYTLVRLHLRQSKLADPFDWPTLGSEAAAISNANKKEISNSTSNSDLREKDKDKKSTGSVVSTNSKPKAESPETQSHVEKIANEIEPVVNHVTATVTEANSPMPDANATNDKEVKNVPKTLDDGAKRVNAKPKWNRFEVEPKSSSAASSQNRRKTDRSPPRRNNRDEYYSRRDDRVRDDDRSNRRTTSTRGSVPSSSTRNPRSGVAPAPPSSSAPVATIKSSATRGPRREPAFITRSNRPSYTESKTPGLNGNPILPMKSSDPYDAKKHKPLLGRPIIIDAGLAPLVTAQNIYGTYYFNGPAPFSLDTIGNIKESIKKQM